jgi:di/tricarboxylate transporter
MATDQIILFAILALVFGFLVWGRWRYDLVAFSALIVAVIAGAVPERAAFSGFGHPAVVIIALVLIISRGLSNAGTVELVARHIVRSGQALSGHIAVMSGLAAALSAVMNNVGALALLMPVDIAAANKAKRSPGLTLMPLSFASILGGLVTLIGTPPNIIIASYRETALGEGFAMFDFTPVGLACALAGVGFVATIGWRLIPAAATARDSGQELFDLGGYIAEIEVPEGSPAIGKRVRDLDEVADEHDVQVLGLVRRGRRLAGFARAETIQKRDMLVIEAAPEVIDGFVGALGLTYMGQRKDGQADASGDLTFAEAVVTEGARIEGRAAASLGLPARFGVTLVGISRQGRRFREQVRKLETEAGDVLLLVGPAERVAGVIAWLGCLPLAERGLTVIRRDRAMLAAGLFAAAIAGAGVGLVPLTVALAAVAIGYLAFAIVPLRQIYESVEWPVIILLGSMIPIGEALESAGGTALIGGLITQVSHGAATWVVLAVLMAVTMTLSDVMNNTATAVITAPIALDVAGRLGASPDPFLMAVAVASSCAFLTPIGHKNNTLILGPGGYRFGDYWRMGLPLEIIVIAVAVPAILLVWPL